MHFNDLGLRHDCYLVSLTIKNGLVHSRMADAALGIGSWFSAGWLHYPIFLPYSIGMAIQII